MNRFWDSSQQYFVSPPLQEGMVERAEALLGYKLPRDYVELLQIQNGGTPFNTCFPTKEPTSWATDHISISGIKGIGGSWGIDSDTFGSNAMTEVWAYPPIGIVICECPSAGHDVVMLDYRANGPTGEPAVVHIETEASRPIITFLAPSFREFVQGLVNASKFEQGQG